MMISRVLPGLNDHNRAFWTGGQRGALAIFRCGACRYFIHPPLPVCPQCRSFDVGPQDVSGRGAVHSFTINYQRWSPDMEVPFVLAAVELIEQEKLWVMTNIVGCDPDIVTIGMAVRVVFSQHEDVWLPFFEPDQR